MAILTGHHVNRALKSAGSYQEWQEAAEAYDRYHHLDKWRRAENSSQYDYVSIRGRLDQLRGRKARHDIRGLLFSLNEGIHGNVGGMGRGGLYERAKCGTKHLIEDYIDEIVHSLDLIAEDDTGNISPEEKALFFKRASHCFGHSALMFSGSGALFLFHIGVAKALLEADLLPDVISGSSGGAIVASLLCTHTNEELKHILSPQYFIDQRDPNAKKYGLTDVADLEAGLATLLPDMTFEQSYAKTARAVNISIAAAETHQTSRLLNETTTPNVLIRSAVMASTAVPGVYPPVTLKALDDNGDQKNYLSSRQWVDGSVSDDLPAKRLARLYGVNHYIVSQANPFVLFFLRGSGRRLTNVDIVKTAARRSAREWINAASLLADRIDKSDGRTKRTRGLIRSVINQDYMGDINIMSDAKFVNPLKLLATPSENYINKLISSGERSTWPKLAMIQQQTKVSRKLREILKGYEALQ
jgi:NTE family protein